MKVQQTNHFLSHNCSDNYNVSEEKEVNHFMVISIDLSKAEFIVEISSIKSDIDFRVVHLLSDAKWGEGAARFVTLHIEFFGI